MPTAINLKGAKAVLCGLCCTGDKYDYKSTGSSLDELEELLKTAGGMTVLKVLQNRTAPEKFALIGHGKLEEIKGQIDALEADIVIFDNPLTPTQIENLQSQFGTTVIDRSMLILEIFALHAVTREGKLQVEMAQLKYTLPRLSGKGTSLSRLGGGGTGGGGARRGAGETKLEIDRRTVKDRLASIRNELEELALNRSEQRKARDKSGVPKVALIGYTNAGKSTLLNRLTDAGVLAEDKLFATLDPTTRKLRLENGFEVLLTDTVGFIKDLPHQLVEAFKSTLDEVRYADLLINVLDSTSHEIDEHYDVTVDTVNRLGAGNIPMITALNKCDCNDRVPSHFKNSVEISAKTGLGIADLLSMIYSSLTENHEKAEYLIPYDCGQYAEKLFSSATSTVLIKEYRNEGLYICAYVDKAVEGALRRYRL